MAVRQHHRSAFPQHHHPGSLDYPLRSPPLPPHPRNSDFPFKSSAATATATATTAAGIGLLNVGNTCYLNSVLQCLIHTVPIFEKLRSAAAAEHHHPQQAFCSLCALRTLVISSMAKSAAAYLAPHEFTNNLAKFSPDFSLGRQQDAHEFLLLLLDSLDSRGSIIKEVFGGTCTSQLRCCKCGYRSSTLEPMNGLSLDIADAATIRDALESYSKAEMIDDILLTCHGCESRVVMEKQFKVDQAPLVVFLHLKRFNNQGFVINKIDKFVEYPLELDLRPFISCPKEEEQTIYDLYGVLVHRGSTASSGHYFSFIRSSPMTWQLMDDSRVEEVPKSRALEQRAYILFYIKKGSSPWFSRLMDSEDTSPMLAPSSSIIKDAAPPILVPDSIPSRAVPKKEGQADSFPCVSTNCSKDTEWILVERKRTKRRKHRQLPMT